MAPVPSINGNAMPLTEYSSNLEPNERTEASKLVPEAFLLPDGHPDYLRLILTSRVYEVVQETPLTPAIHLSNRLECKVLLKREDLQPVFSFKLRGAYNKMAHLTEDQLWRGVVACSAGNHAQGVAYSARHLKIPATIVMPASTPSIKHLNVARLGGTVVLKGDDFDAAKSEAARLAKVHELTNIAPFDDPYVIAGQGTIGMELLRQTNLQELEAIFCCVGGGGLIAGIGVYIKRIAPHVKIIGVETHDANAMISSIYAGHPVVLNEVGLFADGAAVKTVGLETFRLCRDVIDDIIQVSTDETCAAIKDVFEDTRSILEPAGALALAGLKKYTTAHPSPNPNRQLVALASGANMNFDRLRFVAERAALGEQKEALLSVNIPERPGSFAELVKAVLPHPITEFGYRYSGNSHTGADVLMGMSINAPTSYSPSSPTSTAPSPRATELPHVVARLNSLGMHTVDLSGDELAKSHIRYLVGGRPPQSPGKHERLYMFEFPERPGALAKFLTTLRPGQNITLFHYRNMGGDVGKVLAGIECHDDDDDDGGGEVMRSQGEGEGEGDGGSGRGGEAEGVKEKGKGGREELEVFLNRVGYPYVDVTESEVYRMFLRER